MEPCSLLKQFKAWCDDRAEFKEDILYDASQTEECSLLHFNLILLLRNRVRMDVLHDETVIFNSMLYSAFLKIQKSNLFQQLTASTTFMWR